MEKTILFVDDEVNILQSLQRLFWKMDYRILTAESGNEALRVLRKEKIDVIVSDIRMPIMDGWQLLEQVKVEFPKIIRMVLSGYAEQSQVLKGLQNGLAKSYLLKPWDNEELLRVIQQAIDVQEVFERVNLLVSLNTMNNLATIPSLYQKINNLIDTERNLEEITQCIEEDQSISARILQIVNSSFYSIHTGSIKQGILYIGLENLKNLVLTADILEFPGTSSNINKYKKQLWAHSSLNNKLVSRIYTELLGDKIPQSYLSAGLLHDIGRVFLLKEYQEKYEEILTQSRKRSLYDVEREVLGINHDEIGSYLLNLWGLPYPIVEGALFHHSPQDKRIIHRDLVAAIHIADHYSWSLLDKSLVVPEIEPVAFEILGINEKECQQCMNEVLQKL